MKRSGLHLIFPMSVSIIEEDTSSYGPCQGQVRGVTLEGGIILT